MAQALTSNPSKTILITGASSGLGLAIARQLRLTPHRLILTARTSSLPRFAQAGFTENPSQHIRPLDVADAQERLAVIREAEENWGGIDILINNAGLTYRSVVEHVSEAERLTQMDVNFRSPMELTRLVLPGMRRKRAGRIINISSVGGMMAMPTMGAYSASKFALEGATEALWYEVRPWNIQVSLLQPGFIRSNSFERTRYTAQSNAAMNDPNNPYHGHYKSMTGFIGKLMRLSPSTPESVAKVCLRTIQRKHPPLRVPATLDAHLFSWLRRLLPRSLYHQMLYRALPHIQTWGHSPLPHSHPAERLDPPPEEEFLHPKPL